MRRIFGRSPPWFYLFFPNTLPNVWGPGWVKEGLAVYAESDSSKGWGRLGQSGFEGMMRAEVARGPISLREIHADGRGFPHNRDYLYGSYFFLFLSERYGPKAIVDYVENYSNDFIPFRVDSNPVPITRKAQDALWLEYEDWLRARFAARAPQTGSPADQGGQILARAYSITSPLLARGGERWYVQGDGYTRLKLMLQEKGREARSVREVEVQTRLSASPRGELLLSKLEICGDYNYYYDLYRFDAGGDLDRISDCGRFRFAAPLADGRIAAMQGRERRGGSRDRESRRLRGTLALPRRAARSARPGSRRTAGRSSLTSLRDGRWSLIEIADGKVSLLLSDEAIKHSPRFGDTSEDIYFVADYGKVSNVWSWRRGERRLARWSEAANGVKEISAPVAGEMLLTTIEADGDVLRLHRLPDAPLELREAAARRGVCGCARTGRRAAARRPRLFTVVLAPPALVVSGGLYRRRRDCSGLPDLRTGCAGPAHVFDRAPCTNSRRTKCWGSLSYVYNDRHGLLLQPDHDGQVERHRRAENCRHGKSRPIPSTRRRSGCRCGEISRSTPAITWGWAPRSTRKSSTI